MNAQEFTAHLKAARARAGLNRQQLADLLGVSDGAVGNWEAGLNPPSIATCLLIVRRQGTPEWARDLFDKFLQDRLDENAAAN